MSNPKLIDFLSEINGILIKNDMPSVTVLCIYDYEAFIKKAKEALLHKWTAMQFVANYASVEPDSLAPSEAVYPAGAYGAVFDN